MSVLIWIFLIIYFLAAVYFGLKNNTQSIKFLILIIIFQNLFLIAFAKFMTPLQFNLCSVVKELMLYEMVVIGFIRAFGKVPKKLLLCILVVLVFCLKNLITSEVGLWSRIMALRQIFIPIVCLMAGFCLYKDKGAFNKVCRYIVNGSIALGVLGIAEYILGDAFWVKLGYHEYLFIKESGFENTFYNGVTSNFYSWDFTDFPIRRMVSVTADPLATAHFIFLGFLASLFGFPYQKQTVNGKNGGTMQKFKLAITSFLLVCCILSFSKAIIVFMLIAVCVGLFYQVKKSNRWIVLLTLLFMAFCVLVFIALNYDSEKVSATVNHINGLINGIKEATLFGNGLGTAGFFSSFENEVTVGESYIGVMLVQLGWLGGLAFAAMLFIVLYGIYKGEKINGKRHNNFIVIIDLCLMVEMLLSESSVSILGTSLYFIVIGMSFGMSGYSVASKSGCENKIAKAKVSAK